MRRRQFLVLSAESIGGVLVYSLDRKAFRLAAEDQSIRIPLRFFAQEEAMIVAAAASRDCRTLHKKGRDRLPEPDRVARFHPKQAVRDDIFGS